MIKNFILSVCILILFSTYSFSAGSNDTTTTKVKSDYAKAVDLIKFAKKYEKKDKLEKAKKHVLKMVKNQALNCHSGKQIPCEIDSVCIHGDNTSSLVTAKSIKENLLANKLKLKPLNKMDKFI